MEIENTGKISAAPIDAAAQFLADVDGVVALDVAVVELDAPDE